MRVVFMGTPQFSAEVLTQLLASDHDVVAVYTQPDTIRGRGKKLTASPVKQLAQLHEIPVFEPKSLRDEGVQKELTALQSDVIAVAAYGKILPRAVLDIPIHGCLNVHGSLLPRWRGAAPVERALLAGDEVLGVCIMQMEEGLDTGDWCLAQTLDPGERNSEELMNALAELGGAALVRALDELEQGSLEWHSQDDALATYADKIEKGELDLNSALSATMNLRRLRASSSAHPCRAILGDRPCTLLKAAAFDGDEIVEAGDIRIIRKELVLGCAEGALAITELKPEGKKAMAAQAFVAGMPALRTDNVSWSARS